MAALCDPSGVICASGNLPFAFLDALFAAFALFAALGFSGLLSLRVRERLDPEFSVIEMLEDVLVMGLEAGGVTCSVAFGVEVEVEDSECALILRNTRMGDATNIRVITSCDSANDESAYDKFSPGTRCIAPMVSCSCRSLVSVPRGFW